LLACPPLSGLAQNPAAGEQDSVTLPPMKVEAEAVESATAPVDGYVANTGATGTKTGTPLIETPQSISVITADEMEALGMKEINDVLRYSAGATSEPYGPDARGIFLQMRGLNVADEAFFRDGLLLRGSDFASFMSLDPYGAERFELVRGPSSVLYGQISPGGLLNYVSKRPTPEPFGEVIAEGGYPEHYGGAFDVGGPLTADGTLLYRATGRGYWADTSTDFVDRSRGFFAPAVTWQPDEDTSLTVLANMQYDRTGWVIQFLPAEGTALSNPNGDIPRHAFTGEPDWDDLEQTQESIGYEFDHLFSESLKLRQKTRFSHFYNKQRGVFSLAFQGDLRTLDRYGDSGESEMYAFAIDNQLEFSHRTGVVDHTVLVGVDYVYNQFVDLGEEYAVGPLDLFDPHYGSPVEKLGAYQDSDQRLQQVGLYLQDQVKMGGLSLVGGVRYDFTSKDTLEKVAEVEDVQDDGAFTWRIGAIYEFENGLAPYASYATSFNPVIGTDRQGQPFEPETGEQYEVGLKYQPPGLNAFVTLSAFDLRQQNILTTDPEDDRFEVQEGEIHSRGIELEAVATLDFGLDVVLAYAFIEAEFSKSNAGVEGNTPYGIPEHRLSAWADYTFPDGPLAGFGGGLGARYVGETEGDDANSFTVDDSVVFDAALHYDVGELGFAVRATNLFDEEYVASCFTFESGCFYGERLEVIASVAYRW
jgi:iron complex outermembrane recepter protein